MLLSLLILIWTLCKKRRLTIAGMSIRTDLFQTLGKCESGCAYHGITDFVTNTLMKVQHVAVSENSVHNSCVPCTVIWIWRFVLSPQT